MLVLSRKRHQRIMVGDDIVINISDIRGNIVRVGVEAPKGVPIMREEVYHVYNDSQNGGSRHGDGRSTN